MLSLQTLKESSFVAFAAALVNLGFIAFARRTAEISTNFDPLTYTSVGLATIIAGYSAYFILEFLKRHTDTPYLIFGYLAGFVLVASYMPIGHVALGMQNATMVEINVLSTTHVIAATVIILGLATLESKKQKAS